MAAITYIWPRKVKIKLQIAHELAMGHVSFVCSKSKRSRRGENLPQILFYSKFNWQSFRFYDPVSDRLCAHHPVQGVEMEAQHQ